MEVVRGSWGKGLGSDFGICSGFWVDICRQLIKGYHMEWENNFDGKAFSNQVVDWSCRWVCRCVCCGLLPPSCPVHRLPLISKPLSITRRTCSLSHTPLHQSHAITEWTSRTLAATAGPLCLQQQACPSMMQSQRTAPPSPPRLPQLNLVLRAAVHRRGCVAVHGRGCVAVHRCACAE